MDNGLSRASAGAPPAPILLVVEDLIFLSKIQQTAAQTGIQVESAEITQVRERILSSLPPAVIFDLNHRSGKAVEAARSVKTDPATSRVRVLGFLSHVQTDLARQAREAGLDQVMARSTFSQRLPDLLRELAQP
jgi:DNA-binding NarL/FixJ family response regulator